MEKQPTTVGEGSSHHCAATTYQQPVSMLPGGQMETPKIKMYTFTELMSITKNFGPATILGEGGFGLVFKGWVDGVTYEPSKAGVGIPVAVKKLIPGSIQGLNEWQAEVKILGKFSHPNLVKLLGYCRENKELLLVYEYMQNGSLERHLFFKQGAEPLPWETRIKIVMGGAQALAFLHATESKVIHRDFKTSNILLDGDFNAKLSDFGLAKLGPVKGQSHVSTRVMGTYGYAAPEYVLTGHLYVKSDIYAFGVVMLETISGLRAKDPRRPSLQHSLVEWATPFLADRKKLRTILDQRLKQAYPPKGVIKMAKLILNCLRSNPNDRPSMEEVVISLEEINAIKMNPR